MRALGAVLVLVGTAAVAVDLPKHVSGSALVIDGDGFKIGEAEIRLFGI